MFFLPSNLVSNWRRLGWNGNKNKASANLQKNYTFWGPDDYLKLFASVHWGLPISSSEKTDVSRRSLGIDTDETRVSDLVLPFLESVSSLERPWSQCLVPNPFGRQLLCAHGFKGSKKGSGRRTKKCWFKLTINVDKGSFILTPI